MHNSLAKISLSIIILSIKKRIKSLVKYAKGKRRVLNFN